MKFSGICSSKSIAGKEGPEGFKVLFSVLGFFAVDLREMAAASFRFEEKLDGASNFLSWKVKITLLLKENDLWDIIKNVVTPPTNPQQLVAHN